MTKKDYVKLAQILADLRPVGGSVRAEHYWHASVIMLSDILKSDNPNFDAVRFRRACELPSTITSRNSEAS